MKNDEGTRRISESNDAYMRALTPLEKRKREIVASLKALYNKDKMLQTMFNDIDGFEGRLQNVLQEEKALETELHEIIGIQIEEEEKGD